jgi:hypothetical protein
LDIQGRWKSRTAGELLSFDASEQPGRTFLAIVPSFCLDMAWRVSVRRTRLQQQIAFRLHVTSPLPPFVGWCRHAQSSIRVALSVAPIYLLTLLHCRIEACLIAAASRDCFIATTPLFLLHCSGVPVPISSGPVDLPWLCCNGRAEASA